MGSKRIGLARVEKLLENLKREIDWGTATTMKVGNNVAVGMTPEIIFKWNYITCPSPVVSSLGQSADGVLANGDRFSMMWPGADGQTYYSENISIGAFTAAGTTPMVQGTVPATDTATTHAGLDLSMDGETADNVGVELVLGGPAHGSNANKFVVGTHSGYIDATWQAADWTDFDVVVVGFRKAEEYQTGHATALAAAADDGDGAYFDYAALGVMSADDIRFVYELNNSGEHDVDDLSAPWNSGAPVDNQNVRVRITLASDGTVTTSGVHNAVAGAGTLVATTGQAAFSFDSGDTLVPYMVVFKNGAAADELFLKDIEIKRTPGVQV